VLFEEAVDRGLQVGDRPKDAALEPALCGGREEALHRVEPGSRCRGEMERPSRMTFEPSADVLRHVAVLNQGLEPTNIGGRDGERFSSAHRADSHVEPAAGIPSGTQMLGLIH
jgi:hypothetical protein